MSIIYCNECFSVYSESNRNFVITSCTHMYCNDCLIKGAVANQICRVCRASCRITLINDQMPSDVLPYLKNCDKSVKVMCNVMRYQKHRLETYAIYAKGKIESLTNELLECQNKTAEDEQTIIQLTAEVNKLRRRNSVMPDGGRKFGTPMNNMVSFRTGPLHNPNRGFFNESIFQNVNGPMTESPTSTLFPGFMNRRAPLDVQAVEGNENATQTLNMPANRRSFRIFPKIAIRRVNSSELNTPPNHPYPDYMSEVSQGSLSRRTDINGSFASASETTPTSRRRHRMEAIPRNVVTPMRAHRP